MPEDLDSIENYLANGKFKGIGPATAKRMVNTFGKDVINIIKFEPEKLSCIKGITEEKAIEISQSFNENWEVPASESWHNEAVRFDGYFV